jgi:multidrug efflux pump subunit AcrA (membrane-fusion protein)
MKSLTGSVVAACALALACSSGRPPTEKVEVAEAAVQRADTQGAAAEAPLELRLAREKLERARVAMEEERYQVARRLAEQAQVDALLAEAKAETAAALASAQEMRESIETLQAEAERALHPSLPSGRTVAPPPSGPGMTR